MGPPLLHSVDKEWAGRVQNKIVWLFNYRKSLIGTERLKNLSIAELSRLLKKL